MTTRHDPAQHDQRDPAWPGAARPIPAAHPSAWLQSHVACGMSERRTVVNSHEMPWPRGAGVLAVTQDRLPEPKTWRGWL
jgi:hypothetical protein